MRKTIPFHLIIIWCVSLFFASQAVSHEWNFTYSIEGWTARNNDANLRWSDDDDGGVVGRLYMDTCGGDPGMVSQNISISASSVSKLRMNIASYCTTKEVDVWFKNNSSSTLHYMDKIYLNNHNNWQTAELEMGGNSNWTGSIVQLRIDPTSNCGAKSGSSCVYASGVSGFVAFDYVYVVESHGSISGGVRDYDTTDPIGGVAVRLEQNNIIKKGPVYSSSNGVYTITNVSPGTYRLVGIKSGYQNWYQDGKVIASGKNLTGQNIAMSPIKSDLIVQSTYANPTEVQAGSSVYASCTVKNQGQGSAGSSYLKYYLSNNNTYSSSDIYLDNDYVGSLSYGGTSSEYENVTIPSGTTPGNWYILFYSDKDNSVSESNEGNNVGYELITVKPPPPSHQSPTANAEIVLGETVEFTWSNNGYTPQGNWIKIRNPDGHVVEDAQFPGGATSHEWAAPISSGDQGVYSWELALQVNGIWSSWSGRDFTVKQNAAPVIQDLRLVENEITHGWSTRVILASMDPDGDIFSCKWKVINSNGSGTAWNTTPTNNGEFPIFPLEGNFTIGNNTIQVECIDVHTASDSESVDFTDFFEPNTPPTDLYPDGHKLITSPPYEFRFGPASNPYSGSPYYQQFHYIAIIDDNSDFSSPIGGERWTAGSPLVVNDSFDAGKIYYWKICAENEPGSKGPWIESSFEVEPSLTVSDVTVSPLSGSGGDALTINWNSTGQNHWFIYLYDSTGVNPINTSHGLSANCIGANSDGSDGCLDQANPSTATSTTWTIPSNINGEYTIKVKVWDSQGQPPEGVGAVSNAFGVCKTELPPDEPNDVLARTLENPKVYWIKYGKKWLFTGAPDAPPDEPDKALDHFYKLGYTDSQVVRYCSDVLNSLPEGKNILSNDARFVYRKQNPSTVYIIRNGVSDWFFNWQTFLNSEFGTEDVYWATDSGFDWIQSIYQPGQLIGLHPRIRVTPQNLFID